VTVLVAGPYPPTADRAAAVTLAVVRERVTAGDDVDVLAPQPSAAAYHARPGSLREALLLRRLARTHDTLVIVGDASSRWWSERARSRWAHVDRRPAEHEPVVFPDPPAGPAPARYDDDPKSATAAVQQAIDARATTDRGRFPPLPPPTPPPVAPRPVRLAKRAVRRALGRHADDVIIPINRARAVLRARAGAARRRLRASAGPRPGG
jgi:hypothetical protein